MEIPSTFSVCLLLKGGGYSYHFGPRRRKAFSPSSKVESGLKARTKASLSTSGTFGRLCQPGSGRDVAEEAGRQSHRLSRRGLPG
jgi:hypothetical protein